MSKIQIYDTTLRDGSQGEGVNFSLQDKLQITRKLDDMGVDFIEGGYPLSNEKDAEYFQRVSEMKLKHALVCAFGMTRRRGVKAADDIGMQALINAKTKVCTIVGKTSELHVKEVLQIDEAENLAMIEDSVAFLVSQGRRVIYDAEHFFDGYKLNPEFALKTIQAAEKAGAELISLCDTNGGTMPDEIASAVKAARSVLKIPVGIHCHNDCELAVANSMSAVDHGAIQVQGTINGIGERCGNVDLITVIGNLSLKKGYDVLVPGALANLTELSRFVYDIANLNFRSGQAYVGSSAFAHKGGMHVHAVNRLARSYEHIDPGEVGNERRILVSELSGRSNIVAKTAQYGIAQDKELISTILAKVQENENYGYQYETADASFELLVKKLAKIYKPFFERVHYRVNVETFQDEASSTEATVKVIVNENAEHVVADGDGPVNALDMALRKALVPHFPNLCEMQLLDYKVRVINSTEGTAARVRVVIESKDHKDVWSTIGVSENVVEASWIALVDSVEYKLSKDLGH
jgi:2-isopropylmalate synthase